MAYAANAQNWSHSLNSLTSTEKFGTSNSFDLKFFTDNQFRMNLTKSGWLGLGIDQPRGWQEISYCPPLGSSQTGLIVTLNKCNGNVTTVSNTLPDFIGGAITDIDTSTSGGEGQNSPFVVPINFATGSFTNLVNPLYGSVSPIFWLRKQIPSGFNPGNPGPDQFDTKFIVMPDGSCGINIAQPRAALDVRGSNAPNRPAAIFGSRSLGTGYTDPLTGLFQYYTQQVHFVPVLKSNGYNQIVQNGDQGLFFTDGKDTLGSNLQSSFVIAPWAPKGNNDIGGLRMDANGNVGIGTNNTFGYTLAVNGSFICKQEIKISSTAVIWPDFVFTNYKDGLPLQPLSDLKAEILLSNHLPGIPSAEEIATDGIELVAFNALLLEKVEELTLYIIELEERVNAIENEDN